MVERYTLVYAHLQCIARNKPVKKNENQKKGSWQKAKAAEGLHHVTNKGTRCQKAEQELYVKILMLVNIDLFRFNIED